MSFTLLQCNQPPRLAPSLSIAGARYQSYFVEIGTRGREPMAMPSPAARFGTGAMGCRWIAALASPWRFLPADRQRLDRVCDREEKAMGIAITLQQFLDAQHVLYEVLEHKRTGCSQRTADASHVPSECLAKGVVVRHKEGYLLTIVPASRQVRLDEVGRWLDRPVALASEEEVSALFPDCEHGAVPAIASAYGLTAVVDASLEGHEHIYFEGGDHRALVHVTGPQFHRLMEKVPHGQFAA
jgi:Ala-tRNA(Pro) deacylase